jgi:transposase
MAGAYSQDLRDRVIDAVVLEGMSRRAAADRFGVSESVAIKWVERLEPGGTAVRSPSYLAQCDRSPARPANSFPVL